MERNVVNMKTIYVQDLGLVIRPRSSAMDILQYACIKIREHMNVAYACSFLLLPLHMIVCVCVTIKNIYLGVQRENCPSRLLPNATDLTIN